MWILALKPLVVQTLETVCACIERERPHTPTLAHMPARLH